MIALDVRLFRWLHESLSHGGWLALMCGLTVIGSGWGVLLILPLFASPRTRPFARSLSHAGPLLARQVWWVSTVISTAGGLALIAFRRSPVVALTGILLIAAPHLIGPPRIDHVATNIPEDLSRQFIVSVTLIALPCWALLGGLIGHLYRKFSATTRPPFQPRTAPTP